jgi:ribose transport system substrate-binding protein
VTIHRTTRRRLGAGSAIVLLVAALAACSSAGSSSTSGTSSTAATSSASAAASTSAGGASSGGITDTEYNALASNYVSRPPTTGPAPVKNKSIWWISCSNAVPACKLLSDAGAAAAKLLGWSFHVADGNLNQNGGYANAVLTALAAHPSAIVLQGMDCSQIEQPLAEAKAQGVPVLGVQSIDCSAEKAGAPSLITAQMLYADNAPTLKDYYVSWGVNAAKYIIDETGGKAQVIANLGKGGFYTYLDQGFLSTMASCSGCKILDDVQWADADTAPGGPWIQAFTAALAEHPTVNAVFIPFDSLMSTSGGLQAIKDSGLKPIVVGANGNDPEVIAALRDGQVTAITAAQDFRWLSYGAMDELNRFFNHDPSVPEGIGPTVVDLKHNLPAAGQPYTSPIPWQQDYQKLWGVS